MRKIPRHIKADLLLLAVAFIWGSTFVLTKDALRSIGPFTFLGIRFLLAYVFLYMATFRQVKDIDRQTVKAGMVIGLTLMSGYAFQTVGLQYTTASNAGFITGLSVVIVPIIISLYSRSLPGWSTLLSTLIATAGLFLLTINTSWRISYGDLLVLGCALGFALHVVLVGLYAARLNPIALTLIQILFVGLITLGIGLFNEPWPPTFNASVLEALIITSVPATALAFLIQNTVQRYTTPIRTAVIFITEPVFAAGFAYVWAGERLGSQAVIGCVLILAGMLVSELAGGGK